MKNKKIFDAITHIDDELIEEAKEIKSSKLKTKRILGLVASLVLITSISLWVKNMKEDSHIAPLAQVIYPKAYAFDDYDSMGRVRDENPVTSNTIKAINNFAYKTGSLILKEGEGNKNYSPLSLYYALAMATSGAQGDTEKELLDLLGMYNSKTLSTESGNLYRQLYKDNKIGKLKIANSLWLSNESNGGAVGFKDSFIDNAAQNFYASSYDVDFADIETGKAMGKWISENTNGTLSPEIKTNPEQILSIINTVYFYDQWIDSFDKEKTLEDTFYLIDGTESKADFMNQTIGSSGFTKDKNFTRSSLALKNGGEMIFILPDQRLSPYELLSSPEKLKSIFEEGEEHYGEVVWKIPKFSFDSELKLKDQLKELGIKEAFSSNADFRGITDNMAYISDIHQETYISIDEEGVEASAFTQIYYDGSGQPEGRAEMILNRPFIYGITVPSGNLLFMGVYTNPAE